MERREFLRTAAAAMSAPLLPLGQLATAQGSPALYAKAVGFLSGGAYFSPGYLMSSLDVNEETGKILLSRLKAEGLIGGAEKSGFLFSRTFFSEQAKLTAQALRAASSAKDGAPHEASKRTASSVENDTWMQDPDRSIENDIERCDEVENAAGCKAPTAEAGAETKPSRLS